MTLGQIVSIIISIKSKLDSIRNDNRIAVKNTPEHASYLQEYGASIVK